jgi:cytosine/adenosine deaminase-related metal-dependent hydrolase
VSVNERELPEVVGRDADALSLLTEAIETSPPEAAVRERLLRTLQGPERFTPWAPEVSRRFGLTLEEARDALRRIHEPSAWRPGVLPGSRLLATPALMRQRSIVAELPAGMRIARHRHHARELTYILDGTLIEDGELRHERGHLLDKLSGSEHELTVTEDACCLVVFSV